MPSDITSEAVTVDSLIAEHATQLQKVYDDQTAGDHTFVGVLASFLAAALPVLNTAKDSETVDQFPGFYITNDDGYPALTYYPHEDEDGEHVKSADAGTSLDELVQAARKFAASLRGEQP